MVTPTGRKHSTIEEPFSQPNQEDKFISLPNPIDLRSGELSPSLQKIINPALSSDLTPVQVNTQSYARGLFNYITSSAVTGVLKVIENGIFAPHEIKTAYRTHMKQLEDMTGSNHLGAFLTQTSSLIAKSLTENFGEDGFIKQGLEHESTFLKELTESMVTKLAVNIGKHLKQENKEVTPLAIAACVTHLMRKEIAAAQAEITGAKKITDSKKRTEALTKASLPIVDAFLSLAFPNGAKELPLRSKVQSYVWSYLRNAILQKVVVNVQYLPHALQGGSRIEAIKANPQYEIFGKLTEQAERLVKTKGPALLVDKKVAEELAKITMRNLGMQKEDEAFTCWLAGEIQNFGRQDNPTVAELWDFLGNSTGAVFSYMILHLSIGKNPEQEDSTGLIFEGIGDRLIQLGYRFIKQEGPGIQEHFIQLQVRKIKPEDDPEFVARFKPICEDLMEQLGLSSENSGPIEKFSSKLLLNQAPKLLASQYRECLVPFDSLTSSRERLRQLFIQENDGKEVMEDSVAVEQIGNLCGILSQKLSLALQEEAFEKIKKGIGKIPDSLNIPEVKALQDEYLQKIIKSLLMQGLVNYLERVQVDEVERVAEMPQETLGPEVFDSSIAKMPLSKILERIAYTLEKHLHDDASAIQKAAALPDSKDAEASRNESDAEKKKKALRSAFTPLTNTLVQLLSQASADPKKMPVDIPFGALLDWEKIQRDLIPDFLANCYMDTTTWSREVEQSRNTIIQETETPYLPESCKILSQWVSDFLPAMLTIDKEELTNGIYDGVAKFLANEGNPEGVSVNQFLQQNETFIKKNLCEDLFSFFAPDDRLDTTAHPITRQYVQAVLLKLCSHLTKKINDTQGRDVKSQQDFMVNLGINLLTAVNEHFAAMNATTKDTKAYAAHEVPHEQYMIGFGRRLHKGVPTEADTHLIVKEALATIDKERRLFEKFTDPLTKQQSMGRIKDAKVRLKNAKITEFEERKKFFEPLTANLLKFTGINDPTDLPFPVPLQGKIFDLFKNKLIPLILENIFEEILDPATRTKMVISGLKNLNEALDAISPESEEALLKDDETQRRLNKVCGELVLQLVQLVPQSMIQAAFKIDKFRILEKQSAELVGKTVRKYLGDDLNILKMIDKGIVSGIPALHPGVWKTGPKGILEFFGDNPSGELKFPFPLDEDQLEIMERKKIAKADVEMQEMRKMMVDTTHRVMSEAIKDFFTFPFLKVSLIWTSCVDKVFGKYSKQVHEFFNFIGEKTLFRLIETCLSILSYPFRATFWFFMDIYIGYKADHVIKSLHLDIHENLLYQLTDLLIEALEKKPESEKDIEPIIAAAEIRSRQEKVESLNYFKRLGVNIADAKEHIQKKRLLKKRNPSAAKKKAGAE